VVSQKSSRHLSQWCAGTVLKRRLRREQGLQPLTEGASRAADVRCRGAEGITGVATKIDHDARRAEDAAHLDAGYWSSVQVTSARQWIRELLQEVTQFRDFVREDPDVDLAGERPC